MGHKTLRVNYFRVHTLLRSYFYDIRYKIYENKISYQEKTLKRKDRYLLLCVRMRHQTIRRLVDNTADIKTASIVVQSLYNISYVTHVLSLPNLDQGRKDKMLWSYDIRLSIDNERAVCSTLTSLAWNYAHVFLIATL